MTVEERIAGDAQLQCLEQAGEWIVRLSADTLAAEEIAEWVQWCEAQPENLAAFERLQGGWYALDALKIPVPVQAPAKVRARRIGRIGWSAAAGLTVLSLAAYQLWWNEQPVQNKVAAADINRSATLPDGSSMVLSARTSVTVDYTGTHRHLNLSRGEAYFEVQHDEVRPFVVRAGEVSVTAIGTAFDVRHEDSRIIVTVADGIVDVAGSGSSSGAANRWRVAAGYQVAYSSRERTATIALVDTNAILKWREGQLAYLWEPLGTVVEDINRYSTRRVVLQDEQLAALRYTGNVIPESIEDWVAALAGIYPVRSVILPNGDIALESVGATKPPTQR